MAKESPHMPSLVAPDELRRRVREVNWFHTIDLGDGIVTEGRSQPALILPRLRLPDLTGKTVLDIGAWDGFYSFEAERRGAARVLATDWFSWGGGGWGSMDGFLLARRILRSRVEYRKVDVLDLAPRAVGRFDLVLFLGVLYHMRHPLLALERVASVTRGQLVLETHVDLLDCPRPAMAYYPGAELNGDPTNWCGPNPTMVEAMLRTVGFRKVVLHHGPSNPSGVSPRVVFHAWR
jgi:tRNA (mo5U34)-methyltransferase